MLSDSELVDLAVANDHEAWTILVGRYHSRLDCFFRFRGVRCPHRRDELCQDTWEIVYRKLRPTQHFFAFVAGVALNVLLAYRRKARRWRWLPLLDDH
jgi:DNA-directed RNA polymerase specialized sigma24 family protein